MERTVKARWYFRLFSKLDYEMTTVDTTNRVFAYIIDWVGGSLVTAFPTVVMFMAITKTQETNQNLALFPSYYGILAGILSVACYLLYYVYLPYKRNGQTPGKKFMDLKIVKKDGCDVDLKSLFKRQLLGLLLIEGCLVAGGNYLYQLIGLLTDSQIVIILTCISAVFCVLSIIIALKSDSKRMIHDYISDTWVIHLDQKEEDIKNK